jgi:BirA family biotin operon repressor/biotin-[acetyl-CoA-carboxylase] ligase
MSAQQRLIHLLADGELHSGSELAEVLGVSRTAVWKQLSQLDRLDLDVSAQAGQGYRLSAPLELLDEERIWSAMEKSTRQTCGHPEVLWTSASTSNHLLDLSPPESGSARVCLAEYQTSGRGRRGRQWFAPAGHGICLSVAWRFQSSPASLSCLGLAVGVGVLRGLHKAGVTAARLKWPNDIVIDGRKLAGILIDVQGEASGPLHVVAGVGINFRLNPQTRKFVEANGGIEPASVDEDGGDLTAGRNQLAALLINEICVVCRDFAYAGFTSMADEWAAADYLKGRTIKVVGDNEAVTGVALGISADGRLRVDVDGQELLLVTGDVSVRPDE